MSLLGHIKRAHNITEPEFRETNKITVEYWNDKNTYMAENSKRRLRDPKVIKSKNEKLRLKLGDEAFYELPECKICGFRGKQLYKHVFNIHDITVDEYKSKYEGITETKEYLSYLSESRTGENNPMYKNGTSENSPWAVEFYLKRGYSMEESIKLKQEFINRVSNSKTVDSEPTRIEYYMKKHGVDEEAATDMLHNRQSTNSVKNIAERNDISIEDAKIIRDQITKKWLNTLSNKSQDEINEINRKKMSGHNMVSQAANSFFDFICDKLHITRSEVKYDKDELLLEKNLDTISKYRKYDFTYIRTNKIIEYNGDRFHANPKIYNSTDIPITWTTCKSNNMYNRTAKEIWDYDADKIKLANENGYEVLVIWHSDVKKNIYRELRKCKEFLGI
jgi:uncharacterized protein (UPF0305 family)